VEHELTSQIDELSTIVQQKVAFNDTGELLDLLLPLVDMSTAEAMPYRH